MYLKKVNYELRNSGLFFRLGKNLLWIELHILDLDSQNSGSSTQIEVNLSISATRPSSVQCFKPVITSFSQPTIEAKFDEQAAKMQLQQQQREAPLVSVRPNQVSPDSVLSPPLEYDDEEMKMIGRPQV